MISVKSSVEIGDGCQFGPNVKIFDNNHMFTSNEGVLPLHKSSPIKIGKKCWISSDVIILKGVSIGDNCVIGAGCIIKDDIPSKSIVTLQNNLKIRHIEDKDEKKNSFYYAFYVYGRRREKFIGITRRY